MEALSAKIFHVYGYLKKKWCVSNCSFVIHLNHERWNKYLKMIEYSLLLKFKSSLNRKSQEKIDVNMKTYNVAICIFNAIWSQLAVMDECIWAVLTLHCNIMKLYWCSSDILRILNHPANPEH